MERRTNQLERLGEAVAQTIGSGPDELRRRAQEQALVEHVSARSGKPRRRWLLIPAAATVVVAAVALWLLLPRKDADAPLAFWTGQDLQPGVVGKQWTAPAGRSLHLRFDDGTALELEGGSTGLVAEAKKHRIRVALSQGALRVAIKDKQVRRWIVEAGPYRVTALGTAFLATWNEDRQLFRVTVSNGRVLVQGPGIDRQGLVVGPGGWLAVDHRSGQATFGLSRHSRRPEPLTTPAEPTDPDDDESASDQEPDDQKSSAGAASHLRRKRRLRRAPSAPGARGWKALYDQGAYHEAILAAREAGYAQLLARLSLVRLWQLAEAARYAGASEEAIQALLAIRKRFPGSSRARTAAFLIGRVAIEQQRQYRVAARWLKRYIHESPDGPLAEESLGRLISAYQRSGQRTLAQDAARRYLARYKDGIFVALARSVLRQR